MRLINTTSLELHEFIDARHAPTYAILSHRWGDEVSFKDYQKGRKRDSTGYEKIVRCCQLALERKFDWLWVDSCCIDKRSSAELSEAINSMFAWHSRSAVCFAHLADVDLDGDIELVVQFENCEWFDRGWTLQELLAPRTVFFADKNWKVFGAKHAGEHSPAAALGCLIHPTRMRSLLAWRTGIPEPVLLKRDDIFAHSAAQRFSWAAKRKTTRLEDLAYCMLGLFDIQIPLLYGEGAEAFLRLQQEILAKYEDESVFAWKPMDHDGTGSSGREGAWGMFARVPAELADCSQVRLEHHFPSRRPPQSTSRGLEFALAQRSLHWAEDRPVIQDHGIFRSMDRPDEFVMAPACSRPYARTSDGPPLAIRLKFHPACSHLTRIGYYGAQEWDVLRSSGRWRPSTGDVYLYVHATVAQIANCERRARWLLG